MCGRNFAGVNRAEGVYLIEGAPSVGYALRWIGGGALLKQLPSIGLGRDLDTRN